MTEIPEALYREPERPSNCSVCGGLEFSGPAFQPGLGCACHPDLVVWECTTCHYQIGRAAPQPPAGAPQ